MRSATAKASAKASAKAAVIQVNINVFAARAFAKAAQIETCDSSRNRTMWNRLKVVVSLHTPTSTDRTRK
jgi:hypothetical protein